MNLDLQGKRAIVTGGSRGIGKAIARALLEEGVRVVIAGRNGEAAAQTARDLAQETGGEVHGFAADTRSDADVDAFVADAVEALGGLDIVINNAAQPGAVPALPGVAGVTSDYLLGEFDTKVVGYLRVARAAAPHLVSNGWGRIINISGLAARQTGTIPGSARNVAVAALTKNLADELGPKGINVTVVHPGHHAHREDGRDHSQQGERRGHFGRGGGKGAVRSQSDRPDRRCLGSRGRRGLPRLPAQRGYQR